MNTRLVNTVADVINAALTQNRTAAGIATALESAQLLQSPETAAELERLRKQVVELKQAQGTVFRASHDSIVMGLYTTRQAAYEHCETYELRDDAVSPMAWNIDVDGVAELVRIRVPRSPGAESATGYVVTPLEVASEYDEEADE